jgi:hypothetical protein
VYTTSAGPVTISVNSTTMPGYDWYEYPFAWPAIATSPSVKQTGVTAFETRSTFTVDSNSTSISALVDTSYTITCYDGTANSTSSAISPFSAGPTNFGAQITDFFPLSKPNFGILKFPLFVYLGDNAALVTTQTFLQCPNSTCFDGVVNASSTMIYTVAYTPSLGYLGSTSRNDNNGNLSPNLESMFDLISETSSDYSFYSCGFVSSSQSLVRNRKLTSFKKTTSIGSVVSYDVQDGTDCGKTVSDMGQNRAKSCLGSPVTSYWKRIL